LLCVAAQCSYFCTTTCHQQATAADLLYSVSFPRGFLQLSFNKPQDQIQIDDNIASPFRELIGPICVCAGSNIISNEDLRKVAGQEDIKLEIRKRKFRWIGHTLRKGDGEISKAALLWDPQGKRKRGRPRNSWRRSVIKEAGRSWNELRFLSADRQKWKGLTDSLCS
jgi:hypothetical protein